MTENLTPFALWLAAERERTGATETRTLVVLAARCGASTATLRALARGRPIGTYRIARAVSAAIGGALTATQLCEPPP